MPKTEYDFSKIGDHSDEIVKKDLIRHFKMCVESAVRWLGKEHVKKIVKDCK